MIIGSYLLEQLHKHPSAQPQDVVKLCYQAAFGADHLLHDPEKAKAYLKQEFDRTEAKDVPLYEPLSDAVCRVSLAAWKYHGLPAEWLFGMLAAAPFGEAGGQREFRAYLQEAAQLVKQGEAGFSEEEFQEYLAEYEKMGLVPVHHSEAYRAAEAPAYRAADRNCMKLFPLLQKTAQVLSEKDVCVIAIDGRAASGKTTMANRLQKIFGIDAVRMDDFFLPPELRTAERFAEAGGNVHHERFAAEVLPPLSSAEAFSYAVFDCGRMDYNGRRTIGGGRVRLVEGSYSCHPLLGKYADVTVFSDVDEEEQMKRILKRNGEQMAEMFRTRWIPLEEAYFSAYDIAENAEILLRS